MLRTIFVLLLFMSCSSTGFASEQDVHYGLTFWLARKAGFTQANARIIADGDQSLDDSTYSAAIGSVAWIFLSKDVGASRAVRDNHFPSDSSIPASPAERKVLPGAQNGHAVSLVHARLEALHFDQKRPSEELLREFGEALHPYQDSWSHQGIPDSPFRPWPKYRSKLTWGHPCVRGGWSAHDADLTYLHVAEVVQMAESVYTLLIEAARTRRDLAHTQPASWVSLKPKVQAFAEAWSKEQKRVCSITTQKFPSANMTNRISSIRLISSIPDPHLRRYARIV